MLFSGDGLSTLRFVSPTLFLLSDAERSRTALFFYLLFSFLLCLVLKLLSPYHRTMILIARALHDGVWSIQHREGIHLAFFLAPSVSFNVQIRHP